MSSLSQRECAHREEVIQTVEKIHQVLKLTTDIQWFKIGPLQLSHHVLTYFS